jgi:hypothetical protein
MGRILRKLKQLRPQSFYRGDRTVESEPGVENIDAMAAAQQIQGMDPTGASGHSSFPPNYVKTDDGRPRH